jgi:hypothetical protein
MWSVNAGCCTSLRSTPSRSASLVYWSLVYGQPRSLWKYEAGAADRRLGNLVQRSLPRKSLTNVLDIL